MSETLKSRFVIIEPGPISTIDMVSMPWVDVELETEPRSIDHGPDAPERVPTYRAVDRLLRTLFVKPRNHEHVSVYSFKGPADMFVDDMGMLDGHPVNDAATVIYWTSSILRELHDAGGIETAQEVAARAVDAVRIATARLPTDTTTPRIHGRAVLFDGRVWF